MSPPPDPLATEYANWLVLAGKAMTALSNNITWLGQAANATYPLTTAEQQSLGNQVQALTQQVNAIIRVLLGELGSTDGT